MTNEETILKKVIKNAEENGYKFDKNRNWFSMPELAAISINYKMYYCLIFSHEFAKAFWGEEVIEKCTCDEKPIHIPTEIHYNNCAAQDKKGWQYHLQQMVLEEDPIKYLEKFLD